MYLTCGGKARCPHPQCLLEERQKEKGREREPIYSASLAKRREMEKNGKEWP